MCHTHIHLEYKSRILIPVRTFTFSSLSDLKEIDCKSVWSVSCFVAFWTNRINIGLQNFQNLASSSHFFAAIL